jgi:hypothetical protein
VNFSSIVRSLAAPAQPQPDQRERQQAAQFGAAFSGRHPVGWQRV